METSAWKGVGAESKGAPGGRVCACVSARLTHALSLGARYLLSLPLSHSLPYSSSPILLLIRHLACERAVPLRAVREKKRRRGRIFSAAVSNWCEPRVAREPRTERRRRGRGNVEERAAAATQSFFAHGLSPRLTPAWARVMELHVGNVVDVDGHFGTAAHETPRSRRARC